MMDLELVVLGFVIATIISIIRGNMMSFRGHGIVVFGSRRGAINRGRDIRGGGGGN